jgi:hypothetical protein
MGGSVTFAEAVAALSKASPAAFDGILGLHDEASDGELADLAVILADSGQRLDLGRILQTWLPPEALHRCPPLSDLSGWP